MALSIKRSCSELNSDVPPIKRRAFDFTLCDSTKNNLDISLSKTNGKNSLFSSNRYSTSSENDDVQQQNEKEQLTSDIESISSSTNGNYNYNYFTDIRKSPINNTSRSNSFSCSSNRRNSSQVFKHDLIARERCFDYIVQCIDECWARYCNTTSNAEALVYGNDNNNNSMTINSSPVNRMRMKSFSAADRQMVSILTNNCKPLKISDDDFTEDDEDDEDDDEYNGYKSEATNLTEYETDSGSDLRTVSNLPDSVKLQSLKSRLSKAKDDLEQSYDSSEYDDCIEFWRRWDMIKYNAVEMMEEDDDDEIIESVIEELEMGRYYRD